MSGGTVPTTNISLSSSDINSVFSVFGNPANGSLRGLVGYSNLDPGPAVPSGADDIVLKTAFSGQRVLIPPTDITLTGCTTSGGTAKWTGPTIQGTISSYDYYISTTTPGDIKSASNTSSVTNAFTVTLAPVTNYYVSARTKNTNSCSSAYSTTGPLSFPGPATSLSLAFGAVGSKEMTPSWSNNQLTTTPTSSYFMYIGTTANGAEEFGSKSTASMSTSGTLISSSNNILCNTLYYLTISNSNSVGNNVVSYTVTSSVPPAPSVSATQANVTQTTTGAITLSAAGNANCNAAFKVFVGTTSGGSELYTATGLSSGFTPTTWTAVGSNTLIYVTAYASNARDYGSATTVSYPSTVPPAPSLSITQSSVSISNLGSVTIAAPSGNATSASGYKLIVGTTAGGSNLASFTGLTTTAFTSNFTTNSESNSYIFVTAYASNLRGYGDSLASNSIISSIPGAPTVTVTTGTTTRGAIIMPQPTWSWTWVGNVPTTSEVQYYSSGTLTWVSFGSTTTFTPTPLQATNIAYDYFIPNLQYAPPIRLTNSRAIGNSGSNVWTCPNYYSNYSGVTGGSVTTQTYNTITVTGNSTSYSCGVHVTPWGDGTITATIAGVAGYITNLGYFSDTSPKTVVSGTSYYYYVEVKDVGGLSYTVSSSTSITIRVT